MNFPDFPTDRPVLNATLEFVVCFIATLILTLGAIQLGILVFSFMTWELPYLLSWALIRFGVLVSLVFSVLNLIDNPRRKENK